MSIEGSIGEKRMRWTRGEERASRLRESRGIVAQVLVQSCSLRMDGRIECFDLSLHGLRRRYQEVKDVD